MKFGSKYKWLKISYLIFFFWKYYFGHTTFLYSSRRSSGHQSFFFDFRFSSRKYQNQQKLVTKITQCAVVLRTSTHLILKIICPCNTAKNLCEFANFLANKLLMPKKCILEPFWKQMSVLYISVRKLLFQRVAGFYLMEEGRGEAE